MYQLNIPISWGEFKKLPKDTQAEYLRDLRDRYSANAVSLAGMFGVKPLTVRRFVTAKGLDVSFPVGRSMTRCQREAWERFLAGAAKEPEPARSETPIQDKDQVEPAAMSMRRFSLRFDGALDAQNIMNSLQFVLGAGRKGSIEITCDLV